MVLFLRRGVVLSTETLLSSGASAERVTERVMRRDMATSTGQIGEGRAMHVADARVAHTSMYMHTCAHHCVYTPYKGCVSHPVLRLPDCTYNLTHSMAYYWHCSAALA